jgi:hypothetical protein
MIVNHVSILENAGPMLLTKYEKLKMKNKFKILYNLERDIGEETDVTEVCVSFIYNKPHRGHRDSLGCPTEPDEEANVEILSVTSKDGIEIKITDEESEKIENSCCKLIIGIENDFRDFMELS